MNRREEKEMIRLARLFEGARLSSADASSAILSREAIGAHFRMLAELAAIRIPQPDPVRVAAGRQALLTALSFETPHSATWDRRLIPAPVLAALLAAGLLAASTQGTLADLEDAITEVLQSVGIVRDDGHAADQNAAPGPVSPDEVPSAPAIEPAETTPEAPADDLTTTPTLPSLGATPPAPAEPSAPQAAPVNLPRDRGPVATDSKPAPALSEHPGQSGTAPGQTGESPGKSELAPGQTGETPGQSESTPGQGGTAPGQTGSTPGQTDSTPGQSGSAPGQSGETPGKSESAPGQSADKPGKPDDKPGNSDPGKPDDKPGKDNGRGR